MQDISPMSPFDIVKKYSFLIQSEARRICDEKVAKQVSMIDTVLAIFGVPFDWANSSMTISEWIEKELSPINEQAAFVALDASEKIDKAMLEWQNLYYGVEDTRRVKGD